MKNAIREEFKCRTNHSTIREERFRWSGGFLLNDKKRAPVCEAGLLFVGNSFVVAVPILD